MAGNLLTDKRIAIIGGGPGGLTLARLLQMNGIDVKVYERDANRDSRTKGATLDLHDDSGLKALRQAGLIKAFEANYRPGAEKVRVADKNAGILFDEHTYPKNEISRPEIDRGPLLNILLDSLQPGTVLWDSHFVSLSLQNGSWKLEFKSGASSGADIVIGADGANSKIRSCITPVKPFYTGITTLEGTVFNSERTSPVMHKLLRGGKIFAFGDEKTLIVSSKGDGSLQFYTSFKTKENWVRDCGIDFTDKAQVSGWFKREFSGWDMIWQQLFENADSHFIPRPIYCMPLNQTWEAKPNITLLGDAAHLMPPFAGEGVNMAMLDALELSERFLNKDFFDLKSAIESYENQMRTRASEAAKESLENGELMHAQNSLTDMLAFFSRSN